MRTSCEGYERELARLGRQIINVAPYLEGPARRRCEHHRAEEKHRLVRDNVVSPYDWQPRRSERPRGFGRLDPVVADVLLGLAVRRNSVADRAGPRAGRRTIEDTIVAPRVGAVEEATPA